MRLTQRQLEEMIRAQGMRLTPQRRAIVECLETAPNHPTAEDIYSHVNRLLPMTSRATVYNTLHLLKTAGLVQEVFENGQARFDPNLARHHHFVCRRCGQVEDIDAGMVNLPPSPRLLDQRRIDSVEVTLRGLCAECAPLA